MNEELLAFKDEPIDALLQDAGYADTTLEQRMAFALPNYQYREGGETYLLEVDMAKAEALFKANAECYLPNLSQPVAPTWMKRFFSRGTSGHDWHTAKYNGALRFIQGSGRPVMCSEISLYTDKPYRRQKSPHLCFQGGTHRFLAFRDLGFGAMLMTVTGDREIMKYHDLMGGQIRTSKTLTCQQMSRYQNILIAVMAMMPTTTYMDGALKVGSQIPFSMIRDGGWTVAELGEMKSWLVGGRMLSNTGMVHHAGGARLLYACHALVNAMSMNREL